MTPQAKALVIFLEKGEMNTGVLQSTEQMSSYNWTVIHTT